MRIEEDEVYSMKEAREYLKISKSTLIRMVKKGLIATAKVGKQYRIMGKELLRLVSPKLEDRVGQIYNKGRRWIHEDDANPREDQSAAKMEPFPESQNEATHSQ